MPKRKTQQQFEKEILEKLGPDYKVLGTYINNRTKVEMLHYSCGNHFMKNPHDALQKGSGCPFCNGAKPALYSEKWVKENTPMPYHYVSGYTSMKNKCLFHCDKCDEDFLQSPTKLIISHIYGCGCCPTKKITNEQFLQQLGEECLQEYEVLEEYINIDTPIKFKHKKCGTEFRLSPYKFMYRNNKKYCPICYYKKSKGEIIINKYLEQNKINYQKEFSFPELKKYSFDFFLPDYNMCIEYDGEQHFMPIDFFGGKESFEKQVERDSIKNSFCIKNNILLIRIPYSEIDNINQILHNIIKEKSSTTIEKYCINTKQSKEQANGS